jgi:hypothetical protein
MKSRNAMNNKSKVKQTKSLILIAEDIPKNGKWKRKGDRRILSVILLS